MSNKLNGSVDLLAQAMRKVFSEAVEAAVEPMHSDLKGIKGDIDGIKGDIETTNKNMQAQFAEQEEKISKMLSK